MTEQCTRLSSGLCQASLIYQRPRLYIPFIYQTLYTKLIIPNFIYQTIYTKLYIPNFIYQTLYTGTVLGLAIYWFGVEAVVTLYTVDILGPQLIQHDSASLYILYWRPEQKGISIIYHTTNHGIEVKSRVACCFGKNKVRYQGQHIALPHQ